MFCILSKRKKYPTYVSKHNSNYEKQVILFMIPNGEKQHYIAVNQLSAILRGVMSKHHSVFFCLNCFHSFATESKCESHKKGFQNKDFNIVMPSEDTKILEFNQYQTGDKVLFIIYADLECLMERTV